MLHETGDVILYLTTNYGSFVYIPGDLEAAGVGFVALI